jgi:hypothetical protein
MRDLRHGRTQAAGVREEKLRATAGLRSSNALSSWRGRSGRRYIVAIHPLIEAEVLSVTDAVILAVRRDQAGVAHPIDVATVGPQPNDVGRSRWLSKVRERGATELHVHRLAADDGQRQTIAEDLREDESQAS